MPELPEVEVLAGFLSERTARQQISHAHLLSFSALKTYELPLQALEGLTVERCYRRGKFLILEAPPLSLVLHLALLGWVRWKEELTAAGPPAKRGPVALRVQFASGGGFEVYEMGTWKQLAAYVVRQPEEVPGLARLGPDPLDPTLDADRLAALLRARGGQLKSALTDQSMIAGVGNAYSDEILHAARLSPFKSVAALKRVETDRLHAALRGVLEEAVGRAAGLPASGLKGDKKTHLRVHGRAGLPCPECGDAIRDVSFADHALQYCPSCQTGGKPLADRRYSRFLK